jgi:hypothetical protein
MKTDSQLIFLDNRISEVLWSKKIELIQSIGAGPGTIGISIDGEGLGVGRGE